MPRKNNRLNNDAVFEKALSERAVSGRVERR